MIFRTLLIFLKKPFLSKVSFSEKTIISMRVLPTDLDLFWQCKEAGIQSSPERPLSLSAPLKLWDRFELETFIKSYDERYFYIQQRFLKKGELMETGMVKVRFLNKSGGTVSVKEVLDLFKDHKIEHAHELEKDWFGLETKHLV